MSWIVPAPFDTISGGYEYDRRIVAGLRVLGHSVDVVALPGRFPFADEATRDAACIAWDRLPAGSKVVVDGLALHAFDGLDDALAARGATLLVHHPVSLETGLPDEDRDRIRAVEQRLFRRVDRIICTSEMTAESLATEFGVRRERVHAVMPGTDDAPRSTGSDGPTCRILSVGTLVPRKGHDLLLQGLGRLFDLDWHLTIVGSPDRDPVHANGLTGLAQELAIDRHVTFAGEVTGEALETLWQSADLFALATWYEGYGMAIAEALKRGLPVAVTAGGAAGALIEPEAGVVCPVGDRDQLSKSLRRLIFSTGLRREMAERAWQCGQALPSWQAQAARFAAAFA
jgi:glycosyltransferase involved in cell wall biosynthesis